MNSIFNRIHSNAMHMGATVTGESIFLQNSKCNPYEFPSLMGFIRQKWITNNNQPSTLWDEFPRPMGFIFKWMMHQSTEQYLSWIPASNGVHSLSLKCSTEHNIIDQVLTGCWDKFQTHLKFILVRQFLCHTFSRRNEFPHPMGFIQPSRQFNGMQYFANG